MEILGLPWEVVFVYGLLLCVFISFVLERIPPDVTAMGGMCILLAVGILSPTDVLAVFSNSAPITILSMFIISAALERTGCVDMLSQFISRFAGNRELTLLLAIIPVIFIIAPFMNNTPVVIVLVPVLMSLSRKINVAPSKVLIPLSYFTMLSGTMTLIGTSTNLLVNGITIESGFQGFTMFEISGMGAIVATVGVLYILLFGRFLLPVRESMAAFTNSLGGKKYIAQMLVPSDSKLIGKPVSASALSKGGDTEIIDVIRHGDSMRDFLGDLELRQGDRVVVETNAREILGISESDAVLFENAPSDELSTLSTAENVVVEAIVGQGSNLHGKLVGALGFRRKYGVYVIGVHKPEREIMYKATSETLQMGDTLLLEGPMEGMQQLLQENGLVNLTLPQERSMRRNKAPIAIFTLIAVVATAALEIMPISGTALIGAFFLVVTGCLDARDMYKTVDWHILFIIFGMLGISTAMGNTGAGQVIVDFIVNFTDAYGPFILLAAIYALTSTMTEFISNNAVAALLTPIVLGVATSMGLDPKPFLVAVMFGASASFATPISYQTNTIVYGAGGYKFRDFLVIGMPLNILMFFTSIFAIPLFWDF